MKRRLPIVVIAVLIAVMVVMGTTITLVLEDNKNVVGVYHIADYHQYSMDCGELIVNETGDGSYDGEYIEITSCSDGFFEGYCCLPMIGTEEDPAQFPIYGTYDSGTGNIQYSCTYGYQIEGMFDYAQGTIKDGVMQLYGLTYANDESYYAAFQFTFVKDGVKGSCRHFDPIFEEGDEFSSFKALKSNDGEETDSPITANINVQNVSDGLCYMYFDLSEFGMEVDLVASSIGNGLMIGVGYESGSVFFITFSDQGEYLQINREYSVGEHTATYTAYLTPDGTEVDVKETEKFEGKSFQGTFKSKKMAGEADIKDSTLVLTSVSDSLMKIALDGSEFYGNIIPYEGGYIIVFSGYDVVDTVGVFSFGTAFVDDEGKTYQYAGVDMSTDGLGAASFSGNSA